MADLNSLSGLYRELERDFLVTLVTYILLRSQQLVLGDCCVKFQKRRKGRGKKLEKLTRSEHKTFERTVSGFFILDKQEEAVSFESLLKSTLCREQTTPAWCDSCGRYQHTVNN